MASTPPTGTILEVDENSLSDSDSAFGSDAASSTTSLSSSVTNYPFENGRRYHAYHQGKYPLPNDDKEQDRMDLGHHIYLLLLDGKLYLSPISTRPRRVLDLGTGTGIWAIDFADKHPSAEVLGIDLSPIQPSWVPPNCSFEIDDFEHDWAYTRGFDFIHGRELMGFVTDYHRLFSQAFRHLNPGGYFEMQTADPRFFSDDGTLEMAENANKWVRLLHEASAKHGRRMDQVGTWQRTMTEAGFIDVKTEIYKLPVGKWPKDPKLKEIGEFQLAQLNEAIASYTPALLSRGLGWNRNEMEVLCAKVREELKDSSIHLYQNVHIVYGKRPPVL